VVVTHNVALHAQPWASTLQTYSTRTSEPHFQTWLQMVRFESEHGTLRLSVETRVTWFRPQLTHQHDDPDL
jgi:hypothetical protein